MCDIPVAWLVDLAEENLPGIAPKPDDLARMLTDDCEIPSDIVTVDVILENLRTTYHELSGA